MLECSTSMPFNRASKDWVFSLYFIVALLDFESREYMYYYYILLGYFGEATERNQLGSYGSGWVKWGKGGRGNKERPASFSLTSGRCGRLLWLMCYTSNQGIQVWALVKVASQQTFWGVRHVFLPYEPPRTSAMEAIVGVIVLCSWARHFILLQSRTPPRCINGYQQIKFWGNLAVVLTSISSREEWKYP